MRSMFIAFIILYLPHVRMLEEMVFAADKENRDTSMSTSFIEAQSFHYKILVSRNSKSKVKLIEEASIQQVNKTLLSHIITIIVNKTKESPFIPISSIAHPYL